MGNFQGKFLAHTIHKMYIIILNEMIQNILRWLLVLINFTRVYARGAHLILGSQRVAPVRERRSFK